jgi:SAM-dependent methyltransferase
LSQTYGSLSQTYLPVLRDASLYYLLRDQDYEGLAEQMQAEYPYERVGLDRLLAILIDLSQMRITPPARVLDIGCNTGLFSLGLAAKGYTVVGVDSNIAAEVQEFYPGKIIDTAMQLADTFKNLKLVESAISDFLAENHDTFDIGLLLSVVHQWSGGYAASRQGVKTSAQIEETLAMLVSRIYHVMYYEGPDEDSLPSLNALSLPRWFCDTTLVQQAVPIALSVAANGELRTLYRLMR